MMTKHKVKHLEMTCWACPSQWEGETVDGQSIYIRYRWGHLTCHVPYPDSYGLYREPLYTKQIGDPMHGVLDWDEMKSYLADVLEF
jgi:hypothetical protein